MIIIHLKDPVEVVQHWKALRIGFEWLSANANFDFSDEQKTLRQLSFLSTDQSKSFIAVAYSDECDELLGMLVAFDATPIFDKDKTFHLLALMHLPNHIEVTKKLLRELEDWARFLGVKKYSILSRKFGRSSTALFTKLGFKKESLILTKDI